MDGQSLISQEVKARSNIWYSNWNCEKKRLFHTSIFQHSAASRAKGKPVGFSLPPHCFSI